MKTLFDWLDQGTSEEVVGLEPGVEYRSGETRDMPFYHCDMEHCKDAETMKKTTSDC